MFDLPQPFGPTMTLTPGENTKRVRSGKDLKPLMVIELRCICAAVVGKVRGRFGRDFATYGVRRRAARFLRIEALDCARRGLLLGCLLAAPRALPDHLAPDQGRDLEPAIVRRPRLAGHVVAYAWPRRVPAAPGAPTCSPAASPRRSPSARRTPPPSRRRPRRTRARDSRRRSPPRRQMPAPARRRAGPRRRCHRRRCCRPPRGPGRVARGPSATAAQARPLTACPWTLVSRPMSALRVLAEEVLGDGEARGRCRPGTRAARRSRRAPGPRRSASARASCSSDGKGSISLPQTAHGSPGRSSHAGRPGRGRTRRRRRPSRSRRPPVR